MNANGSFWVSLVDTGIKVHRCGLDKREYIYRSESEEQSVLDDFSINTPNLLGSEISCDMHLDPF